MRNNTAAAAASFVVMFATPPLNLFFLYFLVYTAREGTMTSTRDNKWAPVI